MRLADEQGGSAARDGIQAAARGRLLDRVSLEATPKQILGAPELLAAMRPGAQVYVPNLPGRALEDSVEACRRLVALGHKPTAHVPARTLRSRSHFDEILGRLAASHANGLLLIAGEAPDPAGPFASVIDMLETGLVERHGFMKVGFAGHPEGHPLVASAELDRAIDLKVAWAAETGAEIWLVTQFVFEADPILGWEARLRERGVALAVRPGLPGPAKTATLVSYALSCGVAASARLLASRPSAARLFGRWTPDAVLDDLERHYAGDYGTLLDGVHFFPFGGLEATLKWIAASEAQALDE